MLIGKKHIYHWHYLIKALRAYTLFANVHAAKRGSKIQFNLHNQDGRQYSIDLGEITGLAAG